MSDTPIPVLVDQALQLQQKYMAVTRSSSNWHRMSSLSKQLSSPIDEVYTFEVSRETLLEHVGHLPILTSYLHPHLNHQVDLGHTLALLSVHDIAETVTGDIHAYHKTEADNDRERTITQQLLTADLFKLFEEYERHQSLAAQFAKSVDKLAPMILNLANPQLANLGYRHYGITKEQLLAYKTNFMTWDSAIYSIFLECVKRLDPYFAPVSA